MDLYFLVMYFLMKNKKNDVFESYTDGVKNNTNIFIQNMTYKEYEKYKNYEFIKNLTYEHFEDYEDYEFIQNMTYEDIDTLNEMFFQY